MAHGLSCSAACGILPRPGLEPVSPALAGRKILNHCATREVPIALLFNMNCLGHFSCRMSFIPDFLSDCFFIVKFRLCILARILVICTTYASLESRIRLLNTTGDTTFDHLGKVVTTR